MNTYTTCFPKTQDLAEEKDHEEKNVAGWCAFHLQVCV